MYSLALFTSIWGQTANPIEFTEYDLDNGLHVILHEDHSTPIVAVTVMYHVGSKNEDPSRTGMAHFFEHLLFEGSEYIDRGEFDNYVENSGGVLTQTLLKIERSTTNYFPQTSLSWGFGLNLKECSTQRFSKLELTLKTKW